jgi:hypothetical protein
MKDLREIIDQLEDIYQEFGPVGSEIFDSYDMEMLKPVTEVRFDQERRRVQFISDE